MQEVTKTIEMLDELERWIEEAPPRGEPQRFGNLAFRDWGKIVEEVRTTQLVIPTAEPHTLNI